MSERTGAPAPVVPDQAARDLIRERLDVNMLVEAGAGSGKTQSLVGRMAAGIAEGRYLVDHMAAVTFTRKAAAELRGRFQLELEDRLRTEQDPERAGRLSGALGHLERLFAGTIHAFCAHLLRERPVEAGVVPGFSELDETAEAELLERAWREYLDRERAQGSPLLQQLTDSDLALHDLDEAFKDVCRHADVDFPAPDGAAPDLAEAWAALSGKPVAMTMMRTWPFFSLLSFITPQMTFAVLSTDSLIIFEASCTSMMPRSSE